MVIYKWLFMVIIYKWLFISCSLLLFISGCLWGLFISVYLQVFIYKCSFVSDYSQMDNYKLLIIGG